MEPLTIPSSANWYEAKGAVCSPDNTLVYTSNASIVVIRPAPFDKPSNIEVISYAHLDRVIALSIAPTWTSEHKLLASCGDDKTIKVWNLIDLSCAYSHKAHTTSKSRLICVAFINDTKVLSVSEDGLIVVWQMTTNALVPYKNLLGPKPKVSAMSVCPHAGWLAAFGMKNGLIIVTDLRGTGKILYKLRGHEREVCDFSWCPIPVNVIPDRVRGPVRSNHSRLKQAEAAKQCEEKTAQGDTSNEDTLDIIDNNSSNNTQEESEPTDSSQQQTDTSIRKDYETDTTNDAVDGIQPTATPEEKPEACDTVDAKPANGTHLQCAVEAQMQAINLESKDEVGIAEIVERQEEVESKDEAGPSEIKELPPKKKNPWVGLKFPDDEEESEKPTALDKTADFLGECLELKLKIKGSADEPESQDVKVVTEEVADAPKRKVLQAVRAKPEILEAPQSESSPIEELEESQVKAPPKLEYLLASASRGGYICIWRAGSDGLAQRKMKLDKPRQRSGRVPHNMFHLWISIEWIAPDKLLSSGPRGELLMWNVVDQEPVGRLIHSDHPKQLFIITSPFSFQRNNFARLEELAAWTIGHDRNINYTMMHTRKVMVNYPTFAASVQVMASSPIAPTRVAIGLTDGFIRTWDLGRTGNQVVPMTAFKSKLGGKITAVAWHSSLEYILAFGTQDGQVGFVNPGQNLKPPVYFAQHCLTYIYKLEWAPLAAGAEKHGLYCCSDGTLVVYDMDNTLHKPVTVPAPNSERITNFAWKSDYSKLAVGCKSGTVYILDAAFEVKMTLYYQKKAIICMVWHPMQTFEDEELSPHHDWLACANSSDTSVVLYDTSKAGEDMSCILVGELDGHVKPISHMIWSPYKNAQLATLSEDGSAVVWRDKKPVSTFLNDNAEPLLSGIWSPVNEHCLVTAGRDCIVRVWSMKDHPPRGQAELNNCRVMRKKKLTHVKALKESVDIEAPGKAKKHPLFSELAVQQGNTEKALEDCRALFEKNANTDNNVVKLFAGQAEAAALMTAQEQNDKEHGKTASGQHFALWQGNIGDTIRKAMAYGTLTPWLINMAPMVSFSLWQEALAAYAIQLADVPSSDPLEIAAYYLALHKLDAAIDCLAAKQMHREALLLAKFKKPDDAELHRELLAKWTKAAIDAGQFEIAAQCYIAEGQFIDAAKILFKRNNIETLELAIELARQGGDDGLADSIQYRRDALQTQGGGGDADEKLQPLLIRAEVELQRLAKGVNDADDKRNSVDDRGDAPDAVGSQVEQVDMLDGGNKEVDDIDKESASAPALVVEKDVDVV